MQHFGSDLQISESVDNFRTFDSNPKLTCRLKSMEGSIDYLSALPLRLPSLAN